MSVPGPDKVPPEVVKELVACAPEFVISVKFSSGIPKLPRLLEVANVVLLWKHGKPIHAPTSYRPISLLDSIGRETIRGANMQKAPE